MGSCSNLESLPRDCIYEILSRASPLEACVFSLVSSTLRSCADSDAVWRSFLPSDYEDIISRVLYPFTLDFSSYKLLFYSLCHPLLIDHGGKVFQLEKSSGKKSFILSARELSIAWNNQRTMWQWKHIPESRFAEVAELRTGRWLEIEGRLRTRNLTPNTTYGAYLIMEVCEGAYGLDFVPSKVRVSVGKKAEIGRAFLGGKDEKKSRMESVFYGNRRERVNAAFGGEGEGIGVPRMRGDGWMEIEVGEVLSGQGDEEIRMNVSEISYQLKGGLLIEGIEVRPKHTISFHLP